MIKLTLTIEGPPRSGKSRLASTIYRMLASNGVTVGIKDDAAPVPPMNVQKLADMLATNGVHVMIETKQLPRSPK